MTDWNWTGRPKACPTCRGDLTIQAGEWICLQCGRNPDPAEPLPRPIRKKRGQPHPLEAQVLALAEQGFSSYQIAAKVGVSRATAWTIVRDARNRKAQGSDP